MKGFATMNEDTTIINEEIAAEIAEENGTDRFEIDDDMKADWAVRKIAEAEAEKKRWYDYYAEAYAKIEASQDSRINYLKSLLRRYFETVPHKETKTQASYPLPSGKLVLKQTGPKFTTKDEELLPWLIENQMTDYIKTETKQKPMWGELKKIVSIAGTQVVTEDGEIVPGVTVEEQEPTFEIK